MPKKKKFVLIPKIGEAIEQPVIGSGKIKRRLPVNKIKRRKKSSTKLAEIIERRAVIQRTQLKREVKNPLKFPTSAEKICFNYWNSLGYPFVRHRPEKNKTTTKAIRLLSRAVKKDGKNTVIEIMRLAKEVFNAPWFKHSHVMDARKITLPDFIQYSPEVFAFVNKKYNFPISWYKECMKGMDYMKDSYSFIMKDKYPDITKQLAKIWKEYTRVKKLPIDDMNMLKMISERLVEWSELNKDNIFTNEYIDWTIDRISDMLNNFKTYKPESLNYLRGHYFWNKILPKEADRFNPNLADKRNWKGFPKAG